MQKSISAFTLQDHISTTFDYGSRSVTKTTPTVTRLSPTLRGKRRNVSYINGERLRKEATVCPRLFIGGYPGCIRVDLGGVGLNLSDAAFAHYVADDSLSSLHIHRGDIAMIEPLPGCIHLGNLVLLELDGRPMIYQVQQEGLIRVLRPVCQSAGKFIPFGGLAIQGVVIGFVRLFNELRPTKLEGIDANFAPRIERPACQTKKKTAPRMPAKELRFFLQMDRHCADIWQFLSTGKSAKVYRTLRKMDVLMRRKLQLDNY